MQGKIELKSFLIKKKELLESIVSYILALKNTDLKASSLFLFK